MNRLKLTILNFLLLTLPTLAWAGAGGGKKAEMLEKKVSLQGLNWLNYFFAKWYNENLWVYALIVTALMGLVGGVIAVVTDVFLKAIGMEVSKIEHHE